MFVILNFFTILSYCPMMNYLFIFFKTTGQNNGVTMKLYLPKFFCVKHFLKPEQVMGELPSNREMYAKTIAVSYPSIIETVLISFITMMDTIMVSSLGEGAIAAVGITNQPKFILLCCVLSLNVGVTAIVARRRGQEDIVGANKCLRQAIILSSVISFVMSLLGIIFATPLLEFAGAGTDIIADSTSYFRIILFGMCFQSIGLTINAAWRGAGNTKISMRTNIMANIINLTFNYLLITGKFGFPALGVKGAAIATAMGSMVAFLMSCYSLKKSNSFLQISLKNDSWKFDKVTLSSIFKISSSAFLEQIFIRIGFFSYSKTIASLGTIAFSTHQIAMNILNLSFAFGDGLSIATSSLVGQNLGKNRPDLSILYGKAAQRVAIVISLILLVFFVIFRHTLIRLFSDNSQIIATGGILIIITAFVCGAQMSQVVFTGALRGAGDTRFVAISSLICITMIRPVLTYILCYPLQMGVIGAWISLGLDQYLRLALTYARFSNGKWHKIKI